MTQPLLHTLAINPVPAYSTDMGHAYCADAHEILQQLPDNSIHLVITSPPFALQRQKKYGNPDQDSYIEWLLAFAKQVYCKLHPDGSFVLDLGGAYEKGVPVRSLYNFRVLLRLCDEVGFVLAEDFYWYNPARLPGPIEWVNKRKIRVKDAVNTIWWLSKNPYPKADVSQVLVEYSERMKKLLENPDDFYQPAERPSGHQISKNFGKDNGGAIPSNLLQIPNTDSNSSYLRGCKLLHLEPHPARFPYQLPEFFIRFLTNPGDIVLDIFAGSNTTGMVAERENRHWLAIEERREYIAASVFRFLAPDTTSDTLQTIYQQIMSGETVQVGYDIQQKKLF